MVRGFRFSVNSYIPRNITISRPVPRAYSIHEIKSRLRSGNACYHSVQTLMSYSLLPKNLNIRICRTIILPVVLYGCGTWSVTFREERRLMVYENRVLRRLGPRRDEVTREWRKLRNEERNHLYFG